MGLYVAVVKFVEKRMPSEDEIANAVYKRIGHHTKIKWNSPKDDFKLAEICNEEIGEFIDIHVFLDIQQIYVEIHPDITYMQWAVIAALIDIGGKSELIPPDYINKGFEEIKWWQKHWIYRRWQTKRAEKLSNTEKK